VVQSIEFSGLSPELQQRVQNRVNIREGDTVDPAKLASELREIDEHLAIIYTAYRTDDPQRPKVALRIMLRPEGATPPSTAAAPLPAGVYRIGGGVSAPVPTLRVDPEYSEEARVAKWQGTVLLQVVIDQSGVPQDIRVVRSLGLGLDQKAVEAVQKWRFKPGLKDGQPVPVAANIEVNFRLLQSPQPPTAAVAPIPGAVSVGGAVMESRIVQRIPPVYPSVARAARVQGAVQLAITVGPDGRVQNVQVVSGPALLTQAAIESVTQWIYQPFLLNGQPVSVQTTANVNFVLQ